MIRSNSKANTIQRNVDEAMARMLAIGDICVAGQNTVGEDQMEPTTKGILRVTCERLQDALGQADRLGRNFTHTEQRELLTHVRQLYQALASSEIE